MQRTGDLQLVNLTAKLDERVPATDDDPAAVSMVDSKAVSWLEEGESPMEMYECEHEKCFFQGSFDTVSEHEKTCGWLNPEEDTNQKSASKSPLKSALKPAAKSSLVHTRTLVCTAGVVAYQFSPDGTKIAVLLAVDECPEVCHPGLPEERKH